MSSSDVNVAQLVATHDGRMVVSIMTRGGFRILYKGDPEFCTCTKFGFLINYS